MAQLKIYANTELSIKKATDRIVPTEIQKLLDTDCKIILFFSGGKDSVAMVLYLLELGIDKKRIELHHHEVDGRGEALFDWPCTTSYCQAFADAFGMPLIFSWREGGIVREMYRKNEGLQDVLYELNGEIIRLPSKQGNTTRYKWPAVAAILRTRWCSSTAKIGVGSRVINHLYHDCDLLLLTGERRQESTARSKYKEFDEHTCRTKKRNAWHWRPVIDFTEREVWHLFEKYKVQCHPCYELGWSRCSCQICIFSSPNIWAANHELSPNKIERVAVIEKDINHTLYNKMPIWGKVLRGKSFLKADKLARWQDEVLGTFQSPIFVEIWTLPQGAYGREKAGSV